MGVEHEQTGNGKPKHDNPLFSERAIRMAKRRARKPRIEKQKPANLSEPPSKIPKPPRKAKGTQSKQQNNVTRQKTRAEADKAYRERVRRNKERRRIADKHQKQNEAREDEEQAKLATPIPTTQNKGGEGIAEGGQVHRPDIAPLRQAIRRRFPTNPEVLSAITAATCRTSLAGSSEAIRLAATRLVLEMERINQADEHKAEPDKLEVSSVETVTTETQRAAIQAAIAAEIERRRRIRNEDV